MFGISWLAYVLLAAGFGAIALALLAPQRNLEVEAEDVVETGDLGEPDSALPVADREEVSCSEDRHEPRVFVSWPALVDETQADVPLEARLRMIAGLGSLGDEWCGRVLVTAYFEENESIAREAVLRALHDAGGPDCDQVLQAALNSPEVNERVLAVDLADRLGALATLDRALADPEFAVAAAAIYALRKRLNGSLIAHAEQHISRDRVAQLLNAIRVLT